MIDTFRKLTEGKTEVPLDEKEMKFQALAIAKELHNKLASTSFIDMLAVMSPENPAKKEVQGLETKINDITTEVGEFIQKYIPDVAAAEVGDLEDEPEPEEDEEDEEKPKTKTVKKKVEKPKAEKPMQHEEEPEEEPVKESSKRESFRDLVESKTASKIKRAAEQLIIELKKDKTHNNDIIKALKVNFPSLNAEEFLANFKNEKVK